MYYLKLQKETSLNKNLSAPISCAISGITTVCILLWLLLRSSFGIDLTDESFYLTWMSNPWIYTDSLFFFGYIYHPLYLLFDGDIVLLRQANILITFCIAWFLALIFFKNLFPWLESTSSRFPTVVLAAAIAATSLLLFHVWLPTPNYNGLALNALMVAGIGLILARRFASTSSVVGWILIGVAGWLAFMSKISTAASLAVVVLFYLLASGKLNIRLLALAICISITMLLITALVIDGSVEVFVARINGGIDVMKYLGARQTFSEAFRLDIPALFNQEKFLIFALVCFLTALVICASFIQKLFRYSNVLALLLILIFGMMVIVVTKSHSIIGSRFEALILVAIPISAVLVSLVLTRGRILFSISRENWALIFCLILFPYVYAFGTSSNYWAQGAIALIFWVLAGFAFLSAFELRARYTEIVFPLALCAQLITIVLVQYGMDHPYRQSQPLSANERHVIIGAEKSQLILSDSMADYFTELQKNAKHAQFDYGFPMIDLSGHSPGSLFAIGAKSIGQPWNVGGYPGSDNLAVAVLQKVSCDEIAKAWLLFEPKGPRKLGVAVLESIGANLERDYQMVGEVKVPANMRGYSDSIDQQFYKPIRTVDEARQSCILKRTIN